MIVLNPNGNPLTVGSTVEICIDGGAPNTTVTVTIDDGDPDNPTETTVDIPTDGSGNGCVDWTVWSQTQARFNAPGCQEKSRQVVAPIG